MKEYRSSILSEIESVQSEISESELRRLIMKANSSSLEQISENFEKLGQGKNTLGMSIDELFNIGNRLNTAYEGKVKKLNFYKSMAVAMVIFYIKKERIHYFEIFTAFEKLGVFNSSWEKDVSNKLASIDDKLASIEQNMMSLNEQFTSLVDNTEEIVGALKQGFEGVNSRLNSSNLLQSITAYQTYRTNQNTKGIGQ